MIKFHFGFWISTFLLLFISQKAMTQDIIPEEQDSTLYNSLNISIPENDSIDLNKPFDYSVIKSDTIKKSSIDAPVNMASKDSMRMTMKGSNKLFLYGNGTVKYKNINLEADYIEMNADSSVIYARYQTDSLGVRTKAPVFTSGETRTEMEQLWYNFKSTKSYSINIITQQGEGFIKAEVAKKMPDETFNMHNGKYTTCDDSVPHFYFNLTKAKFRPGKSTVTGPVYLVMEGVPTPIALPFGYFPASKSYSSGILMPTYGDEMSRGFALRDGGYYFAFSDYVDAELKGEIYTKGSWGLSARSAYRKRYKYSGDFNASYLVTVLGDKDSKDLPNSDYSVSRDIKVSWSHRQDAKSNPYGTFSANVNFSTSSYNRNNFGGQTLGQMTENTKVSSVSYSFRHPVHPVSINTSASISQTSRDSTLSVSLPDITISVSSLYPFKRREQIGSERWYEKIYMSYSGTIKNSIDKVKENEFFKKNVIKDWRNGIKHSIPVSASFNLLKHITISTSFNYNENWYSSRINYEYDYDAKRPLPVDTLYGFFRAYQYNASVSMNTKLYGMYKPWSILGKWTKGVVIRHVLTPSISFSGAPDFSDPKYGAYKEISYYTYTLMSMKRNVMRYPYFQNYLFGGPSKGKTGSMNFSFDNNLEAKIPIAGTDSTRKVSLIDNFRFGSSYNFLVDSLNWSVINASIRIKLFGSSLSLSGNFDPYMYGENGTNINVLRLKAGKGIGRFMGTSTGYNYTINNETFKKLFKKGEKKPSQDNNGSQSDEENEESNNVEREPSRSRGSTHKSERKEGDFDSDGYLVFSLPWSLSVNYSVSLGYDRQKFDKIKREYPYRLNHTLGFNGEISPTKAWNLSFNGSYDFEVKRIVSMHCRLTRAMHCWSMSAEFVPFGPTQNYYFSISVNSSLLQDVKYQQRSNYRDAHGWGER